MTDSGTDLTAFIAEHAHPLRRGDGYLSPRAVRPAGQGRQEHGHLQRALLPHQGAAPGHRALHRALHRAGRPGPRSVLRQRHDRRGRADDGPPRHPQRPLAGRGAHRATTTARRWTWLALRAEFERIKAAVKEEFDWLYGTTCDRCGGPATIQQTVWSDVFECGRCGGELGTVGPGG